MPGLDSTKLPKHVAIIMDGNGRWAKAKGLTRVEGHRAGTEKSDEIITAARELGIKFLTLYAFSSENWNRPEEEVKALMNLLNEFLKTKRTKMISNNIRLTTIGHRFLLPEFVRATLEETIAATSKNNGLTLTLALSYGSRDEILRAVNSLLADPEGLEAETGRLELTEESFSQLLDTAGMPDPDLIIRTSGECRISNFLLWQGAYAEFIFEEANWPDYSAEKFKAAIAEYQKRERRYGNIIS